MKSRTPVGKGSKVRPTTGKVLETLMAIIADELEGVRFLDLFAGTGQVGLAALRAGAREVVFVEDDPRVAQALRHQINDKSRVQVLRGRIPSALLRLRGPFQVIWADPPYDWKPEEDFFAKLADLASDNALLVAEHHHKTLYQPGAEHWTGTRQVKSGETRLSFFRRASTMHEPDESTDHQEDGK